MYIKINKKNKIDVVLDTEDVCNNCRNCEKCPLIAGFQSEVIIPLFGNIEVSECIMYSKVVSIKI